uniref:Cytochrome c oxidase subunit 2 n=1 Tax=Anoplodactylus australis TaxID=2992006 RepID=A0A9E7V7H3_9CHEL|nr:cytochrome c oxidase subunit 2 [Anoplodactylus australis]UZA61237.1 cytochrome c oxidase subunit 2 [Anoplodactylus australis]
MPTWNHISLQDSASPIMEQLVFFHDHALMILTGVTMFIVYMMCLSMMNSLSNKFMYENQEIELMWTAAPMIILFIITLPSLRILYIMEESINPFLSIKSIGHQWYWSYEYSDFHQISFDSFMIDGNMTLRLLDVDNRLMIPFSFPIRLMTTSADVIHSWTVPSLGMKMDSIPGRLNQGNLFCTRPGIFIGQCSEICGANHSFMPIVIESINLSNFVKWILKFS